MSSAAQSSDRKDTASAADPPATVEMPAILRDMAPIDGVASKPPTLRSPLKSQLTKAILDARPAYRRDWLKDVLSDEDWKIIEAIGPDDRRRKANTRLRNALLVSIIIDFDRNVEENDSPLLVKCGGAESEILRECLHNSDVELDL